MVLLASDYDKSRFLKADDIDGERKFRIKSVGEETLGTNKEQKLVVWFTNDKRGLVLNKTNNRVLRGAFGDDTKGWANKIVIVFAMPTEMGGKMVQGLRVRLPPPKQAGTAFMSRGQETQPLGNGPTVAKPANTKKPPVQDELDEVIESQPSPKHSDDELDDEIDF